MVPLKWLHLQVKRYGIRITIMCKTWTLPFLWPFTFIELLYEILYGCHMTLKWPLCDLCVTFVRPLYDLLIFVWSSYDFLPIYNDQ